MTDVDPTVILQAVTELDGFVRGMQGCVNNIGTIFSGLDKSWTGEAKIALFKQLESDKKAFNNFISEYQKLNDAMKTIGNNYQKSHDEVLSEMLKLKK